MIISNNQAIHVCKKLNESFVSISFLGRGSHNEAYLLKTENKQYVIIVENNHYNHLKKEYSFLKLLNGTLAPKTYLFDNSRSIISKSYLVQDYLEGTHPSRKVDTHFITLMAHWYKQLHSHKKTSTIKTKEQTCLYQQYQRRLRKIRTYSSHIPQQLKSTFSEALAQAEPLLSSNITLLAKRKQLSIVHGDPTRMNVFYDKESVKLIDWEFVRYDHPETDLVFFKYSYDLTEKQWKHFLDTYKYSLTKNKQRLLDAFFVEHCVGVLSWRLERLHLLSTGQLDKRQKSTNKKELHSGFQEDMNLLIRILRNY